MASSIFFSPRDTVLTVESARNALFLWLAARQQKLPFGVPREPGEWRDELRWLGLDWDAEEQTGEPPQWAARLPAIEAGQPTPWGQWSGETRLAEVRELGVLPEAMLNFLALLGWEPVASAAPGETFSCEELLRLWSPERIAGAPVRFDLERLRRINHEWLERTEPDRLVELAVPYYQRAGWLPAAVPEMLRLWLRDVIHAVLPGLDFISLLPPRTRLVFDYHAERALEQPESRAALEREGARAVIRAFGLRALEDSWLTVERFREILAEVKRETRIAGRHLIQPVQVMLTGLPFGPALEELIPIIERGAELPLPVRVKSCRERVLEFCSLFV
ncbi:MAG: hypothetical protein HYY26_05020 [Acidobacteria bacterium]|nr:hypothetical protein [Acidobacteriota bacterium]